MKSGLEGNRGAALKVKGRRGKRQEKARRKQEASKGKHRGKRGEKARGKKRRCASLKEIGSLRWRGTGKRGKSQEKARYQQGTSMGENERMQKYKNTFKLHKTCILLTNCGESWKDFIIISQARNSLSMERRGGFMEKVYYIAENGKMVGR
ncbi:hypothetical protein [Rubeoparvulum massiliense]|uniref:hypothetical protein n=1 Tax=Rubeoparvulum massiliense TaxID=1631346 RepID=UPI0011C7CCD3|nr:hypothetical protein [Rubeoparvulum massiliense]